MESSTLYRQRKTFLYSEYCGGTFATYRHFKLTKNEIHFGCLRTLVKLVLSLLSLRNVSIQSKNGKKVFRTK